MNSSVKKNSENVYIYLYEKFHNLFIKNLLSRHERSESSLLLADNQKHWSYKRDLFIDWRVNRWFSEDNWGDRPVLLVRNLNFSFFYLIVKFRLSRSQQCKYYHFHSSNTPRATNFISWLGGVHTGCVVRWIMFTLLVNNN